MQAKNKLKKKKVVIKTHTHTHTHTHTSEKKNIFYKSNFFGYIILGMVINRLDVVSL